MKTTSNRSKAKSGAKTAGQSNGATSVARIDFAESQMFHGDYRDEIWFRSLRIRSLNWFKKNSRKLPWRSKSPPTKSLGPIPARSAQQNLMYRVWVSEIMLQQTQVQTVIDYFNQFIARFPSIAALAKAPETEVLTLWEGLGYYRRARSLHAAARKIVGDHNGEFPQEFEQVIQLPGIGRYTAGAILSISLDQRHPILEGNTYRLYSRLLGLKVDPRQREAEKMLWQFAADLLPGEKSKLRSGQLNQALMEIGSKVCTVRNPDCSSCPLMSLCQAHRLGLEQEIPRSTSKTQYEDLHQALFILEDYHSRALVRQRRTDEWWSGLWDFVRINIPTTNAKTKNRNANRKNLYAKGDLVADLLQNQFGIQIQPPTRPDFTLKHAVTKYRIKLDCFHIRKSSWQSNGEFKLQSLKKISDLPLNVTARKALSRIIDKNGASTS